MTVAHRVAASCPAAARNGIRYPPVQVTRIETIDRPQTQPGKVIITLPDVASIMRSAGARRATSAI